MPSLLSLSSFHIVAFTVWLLSKRLAGCLFIPLDVVFTVRIALLGLKFEGLAFYFIAEQWETLSEYSSTSKLVSSFTFWIKIIVTSY